VQTLDGKQLHAWCDDRGENAREGTLVALVIIVAGVALIYSGWQSNPVERRFSRLGLE
jgi:hypothetical protein